MQPIMGTTITINKYPNAFEELSVFLIIFIQVKITRNEYKKNNIRMIISV